MLPIDNWTKQISGYPLPDVATYWYAFTNEMQLGTWSFYDFDVHHGNNSKVFEPGNCNVKFN